MSYEYKVVGSLMYMKDDGTPTVDETEGLNLIADDGWELVFANIILREHSTPNHYAGDSNRYIFRRPKA